MFHLTSLTGVSNIILEKEILIRKRQLNQVTYNHQTGPWQAIYEHDSKSF